MILEFLRGFRETMDLTCFRGPWAYEVMASVEAVEPENAYDFGAHVAVIMVRGDETRRRAQR